MSQRKILNPQREAAEDFPYGAQATASDPSAPDFPIVYIECREPTPGHWWLFGWGWAGKDIWFDLEDATKEGARWFVRKAGIPYVLTPLSTSVGNALKANIDDGW